MWCICNNRIQYKILYIFDYDFEYHDMILVYSDEIHVLEWNKNKNRSQKKRKKIAVSWNDSQRCV